MEMSKKTILSVDDDQNLQTVVQQYLEDDGYKFIGLTSFSEVIEKAGTLSYDLLLLDLVLPDGEGLSLISLIRAKSQAPIIVVSGKEETMEKIICLEMGADDYITKPFEMRELSARIKAVLRRGNDNPVLASDVAHEERKAHPERIRFNGWVLDRLQYELFTVDGHPQGLTTGEFQLLEVLVLSPKRVLSRERLFAITHKEKYDIYDRAIDIKIARLRKKLNDKGTLIKTVRGIGYIFLGETEPA